MSTQTTNLGLIKPSLDEKANINIINQNADMIDAAVPFKFAISNSGKYGYLKEDEFVPFGSAGVKPALNAEKTGEYDDYEQKLTIFDTWKNGSFTDTMSVSKNGTFLTNVTCQNIGDRRCAVINNQADITEQDVFTITSMSDNFTDSIPYDLQLNSADFYVYGDGHLNSVSNGYNNHIRVNGTKITMGTAYPYFTGNFNNSNIGTLFQNNAKGYTSFEAPLFSCSISNYGMYMTSDDQDCYQAWYKFTSGTNTVNMFNVPSSIKRRTVVLRFYGSAYTYSWSVHSLKIKVNNSNTFYSLNELITQRIIEPLVLLQSGHSSGSYYFNNMLSLLTGSNTDNRGNYPNSFIIFTLRPNNSINAVQFYSNTNPGDASRYADGIRFTWFNSDLFNISYVS